MADRVRDSSYLLEDLIHYDVSDVNQNFEQLALLTHFVHLLLNLVATQVAAFRTSDVVRRVGYIKGLSHVRIIFTSLRVIPILLIHFMEVVPR